MILHRHRPFQSLCIQSFFLGLLVPDPAADGGGVVNMWKATDDRGDPVAGGTKDDNVHGSA